MRSFPEKGSFFSSFGLFCTIRENNYLDWGWQEFSNKSNMNYLIVFMILHFHVKKKEKDLNFEKKMLRPCFNFAPFNPISDWCNFYAKTNIPYPEIFLDVYLANQKNLKTHFWVNLGIFIPLLGNLYTILLSNHGSLLSCVKSGKFNEELLRKRHRIHSRSHSGSFWFDFEQVVSFKSNIKSILIIALL